MNIFSFLTGKQKSKDVAKNRLKVVLVQDKGGLSDEMLAKLQGEIMEVISRYIEIDDTSMDVGVKKIETDEGELVNALVANIPIKMIKRQ
ncbi:MAG: cell division topological specificity factor MinE [Peptostreptococcaceae bacterium]|nr:cell division topological specificity factor MinE [Peptostreptococcaceae bacterium]